jgi:glycosyltransferase involved in cell wall biosynthesis
MGHASDDLVFVVVGGYEYSSGMNQPATVTVRELARKYRVLNVHSDAHGALLRRVLGRAGHMDTGDVARTLFGSMRPRRVEERLWLVPVRGLASIGPLSVPEPMRRRNVRLLTRIINGWLDDVGAARCVLLFYWWSLPELVDLVPHVASIYDCTDDFSAVPGGLVPSAVVTRVEGRLLDVVDRAYVVSPALLEGRAAPGRRIEVLPNGFDERLFTTCEQDGFRVPETVRRAAHPMIGYAGGFTDRIDWALLTELARRRPEWTFMLTGGEPAAVPAELSARTNVVFQSASPYPEALGAISCFDVATIPARIAQFSRGNSFLKLLDYFAHGTPVVAPPLPDTRAVADDHPGLLTLADGADAWEAALAAALDEPADSPLRAARRAYVAERTVERRVASMIEEAISGRRPEPRQGAHRG